MAVQAGAAAARPAGVRRRFPAALEAVCAGHPWLFPELRPDMVKHSAPANVQNLYPRTLRRTAGGRANSAAALRTAIALADWRQSRHAQRGRPRAAGTGPMASRPRRTSGPLPLALVLPALLVCCTYLRESGNGGR